MIDVKEFLATHRIEDVIGKYERLKKDGIHMVAPCPFHDEKTSSFKVTPAKQIAKCFGCGWSGDAISFVMQKTGCGFKEAISAIEGGSVLDATGTNKIEKKQLPPTIGWKQIKSTEPPSSFTHYRWGEPSNIWTYRDADGVILGYVCRFNKEDGGKEVLPYIYATDGKRNEWRWMGFDVPRPMYNLHLLARNPKAIVVLVEGEKAADAAQAQLDPTKAVVMTWIGGGNAVRHADFTPIYGRRVFFWGDNDVQGLSAMLHVRHLIQSNLESTKIIPLDATLQKGWDCADKDWAQDELREFLKTRAVEDIPVNHEGLWRFKQIQGDTVYQFGFDGSRWVFNKLDAPAPPENPPFPPKPEPKPEPSKIIFESGGVAQTFFQFLGYAKAENGQQEFYFYVTDSKQIYRFTAASMTSANLLSLAHLSFWETNFESRKATSKFDTLAAVNWLVRASNERGTYNSKQVRGRGAWMDAGRSVIHAGNRLIVDFAIKPLGSIQSKYIYEAGEELDLKVVKPLPKQEASKMLELLKRLNWERPINPYLLAGWCVVAPMCGALHWRPHIWLTGAAGTGKSWVFDNIVKKLLGNVSLAVQGETSEAGLRQYLRHDAIPVIFDESEGADKRAHDRMKSVMALMRSASTKDGSMQLKGSATGSPNGYRIRSCFAFASIAVQLEQQSDKGRVSVLGLRTDLRKNKREIFAETVKIHHDLITDDFADALRSRTMQMLPTILHNSDIFASAGAAALGTQRVGDQIGTLLAGVYSLFSDAKITYEAAVEWIEKQDWSDERSVEGSSDELRILGHLMEQVVDIDAASGRYKRTVGELILLASMNAIEPTITDKDASNNLGRLGFKVVYEDGLGYRLCIANSNVWLRRTLENTPWANNHHIILQRLKGAIKGNSTQFMPLYRQRCTIIPFASFLEME